jgi:hypothetical protein
MFATKKGQEMQVERPVDPSNIKWKNMQIKTNEKMVRGSLVLMSLLTMLYFSYLLQVMLNDSRFENKSFEKINCNSISDSRSIEQMKAYSTWSDYFVKDKINDAVFQPDELVSSQNTASIVNGTLSCFCNQQMKKRGWYKTTW